MRHSVIAWDSSYRDFFHLVRGMQQQDYDTNEYELIYVEQRSQAHADNYARLEGVEPLSVIQKEIGNEFKFEVLYLDDPLKNPYHLGKCVNRGIEAANGEYISVMDGDQLLPPDFLTALDNFHAGGLAIANVTRRMASQPVGVTRDNWKDAIIDFERCLNHAPNASKPIPESANNYGPLISAPTEAWEAINYYSLHDIWSTGLSRLGGDANARLERHLGVKSRPLPDTVTVHPWHPSGFSRNVYRNRKLLELQGQIMDYSERHGIVNWEKRLDFTNRVYNNNKDFIKRMISSQELSIPGTAKHNSPTIVDKLHKQVSSLRSEFKYGGPWGVYSYCKNCILGIFR